MSNLHQGHDGPPSRVPVPKRVRFEVFKRDGFACIYCGATPPGVVLHCDHIDPVAGGGSNEMENLVTACESCNQGKGAVPLGRSASAVTAERKLAQLREAQEVEALYNQFLAERRIFLDEKTARLIAFWHAEAFPAGFELTESPRATMRQFAENLTEEDIADAVRVTVRRLPLADPDPKWSPKGRKYQQWQQELDRRFRYFCGVCWKKIKGKGVA